MVIPSEGLSEVMVASTSPIGCRRRRLGPDGLTAHISRAFGRSGGDYQCDSEGSGEHEEVGYGSGRNCLFQRLQTYQEADGGSGGWRRGRRGATVSVITIDQHGELPKGGWDALAGLDAIIYGSSTYMGGPAWQFKKFADASLRP